MFTEEKIEDLDESPLTIISTFKPINIINDNLICQITPAKFDSLLKVLNVLKLDNSLIIQDSVISQSLSDAVITTNVSEIFGNDKINLHVINPKKYLRLFKNFKSNNNIYIIDDIDNSRFIVTNGEIKLFLPKQIETLVEEIKIPDLSNYEPKYTIKIDKSARNIIVGLATDASYIEYLIQDDLLKGIHIPETAIYLFSDYSSDPKAEKLDETNADLSLRSTASFVIPAEDYMLTIYKKDENYILLTKCNMGFIGIDIYEPLEISTGGNILLI